jgi:hypothetical protein
LLLCQRNADRLLRLPPLLLVGEPGIGKTIFARQLAQLLGTDGGRDCVGFECRLFAGWTGCELRICQTGSHLACIERRVHVTSGGAGSVPSPGGRRDQIFFERCRFSAFDSAVRTRSWA